MAILNRTRLPLIPVLYAAILSMLALAAWNPALPGAAAAIDLMLVMDESDSIGREHNQELWTSLLRQVESLPPGSRFSLLRFADRPGLEIPWTPVEQAGFGDLAKSGQPPRRQYLDTGASDIRAALDSALRQLAPARRGVILLSSDGKDTAHDQYPALGAFSRDSDYTLYHVSPAPAAPAAARIDSIDVPSRVYPGDPLPVSIAVEAGADSVASLEILLNRETAMRRQLQLAAGVPAVVQLSLAPAQPGTQSLEFLVRDQRQNVVDRLTRVVDTDAAGKLLHIGNADPVTASALALPRNWDLVRLSPAQLSTGDNFFSGFDVVLLDDLEADSLGPVLIRNLERALRQFATGLVVLGGPRSFGSGGYRHSRLEKLLPVTAESSRPLPAAAFLFLLDKSGSMETADRARSRLENGFRAVRESARSIRAGDESALLVFDRETRVLLPLQARADLESDLDRDWQLSPSGGTRLAPALAQATRLLAGSESPRRFLILVTDGFADIDDIGLLASSLRQADIRLIALATGSDARLDNLEQLATGSGGRLLRIGNSANLPRFMRRQLELTRPSWSEGPVIPVTIVQPPFIDDEIREWSALPGYQVTRAKPGARVYLATDRGDPLLASDRYGAGRVAVLPGGIPASRSAGSLSQALLGWMNSRQHNPDLSIRHHYLPGRLALTVDAVTPDGRWLSKARAQAILTGPAGTSQAYSLEMSAPGRYSAVLQAPPTGLYQLIVQVGDQQSRLSLLLDNNAERTRDEVAPWFQQALDDGVLEPWSQAAFADLRAAPGNTHGTRAWWLALALIVYLSLMAAEHSSALARLRQHLPRIGTRGSRH